MDVNFKIPYAKDENLPSLEKIRDGFEKIDCLNIDELPYDAIRKIFFDNLNIIPKIINPYGDLTIPIYRISIVDESKFDLTNIQSFSHPPFESCPKGRCNLQGHPLFYGSISADTALRERRKENNAPIEKGDEVYISQWQIKKGINFRYSQFIFGDDVQLGEWIRDLNQTNAEKIKQISNSYSQNKQDAFMYLNNKLSKYFVSDNYNISSFLGHYILYDKRDSFPLEADGIMYPSIQAGLNNINIAIHPNFVKSHLQLIQVQKIKFGQFENNGSALTLLKTGFPNEQNKIEWFSPSFNTNDMKITGIEVMFDNEPKNQKLSDKNVFLNNDTKQTLEAIAWEYIDKNMPQVLDILSKVNNEIDYKKVYKKDFFIRPEKKAVSLELNNERFFINTIKVSIDYKLAQQKEN